MNLLRKKIIHVILNWKRITHSCINFSKNNMNLKKCYFRHKNNEDIVDITFLFSVKESARQFNFSRKTSETLQTLFTRIGTNIQKAVAKANKKKKDDGNTKIEIKLLDHEGNPVPGDRTCLDLFHLPIPMKLTIHNHEYEPVFNPPWVINISLPQSILIGFPVYPEYFVTQNAINEKCVFNWYRGLAVNEKGAEISENHIKWELASSGFSYIPTSGDIGMRIKIECIPGNETSVGPAVHAVSKNVVEAGPGTCPFETRHMFTTSHLSGKSFRCVTYNILADLYCDSDFTRTELHPYCPPYALHIDYRKQLIMKELSGYNADIISLQEVDTKIYNNCLTPFLASMNYDGLFFKKGKEVAEGLACFYRKNRFRVIEYERLVLAEALTTKPCLQSIWDTIKDNEPLVTRLLDRTTIASATVLESIDNENEIVLVANTHLYFHPDADHIRLIQGGIVIYWLMDIKNNLQKQMQNKRVSLILCGDFNSVPSCGIYQLYTTGSSPSTLPDWKSNATQAVYNLSLKQDLPLASACGTPPFTNFTSGFADCLDYIFYDTSSLEVEQVIPLPSDEELRAHTALPSIVFPSDHIALVSDLRFK